MATDHIFVKSTFSSVIFRTPLFDDCLFPDMIEKLEMRLVTEIVDLKTYSTRRLAKIASHLLFIA